MGYNYSLSLSELESELGQLFTWSGADYPCVIGARNETKTLGDGGYALDAGLEIVVRLSAFANGIPAVKDGVIVDGRLLQIASILHDPGGEFLVLTCDDPTKGV